MIGVTEKFECYRDRGNCVGSDTSGWRVGSKSVKLSRVPGSRCVEVDDRSACFARRSETHHMICMSSSFGMIPGEHTCRIAGGK
jgi:hypothetical protein